MRMAAARLLLAAAAALCLIHATLTAHAIEPTPLPYTVGFFSTRLDHSAGTDDLSDGANSGQQTFKLKYLYDYSLYKSGGPIFFHCGGQESAEAAARRIVSGPVNLFLRVMKHMMPIQRLLADTAAQFHAALVWAEHRYYGESLPFGNESSEVCATILTHHPTDTNKRPSPFQGLSRLRFLGVKQVLADYALLINDIRGQLSSLNGTQMHAQDIPVIAYGYGYGGNLATWLRLKHPNAVHGYQLPHLTHGIPPKHRIALAPGLRQPLSSATSGHMRRTTATRRAWPASCSPPGPATTPA